MGDTSVKLSLIFWLSPHLFTLVMLTPSKWLKQMYISKIVPIIDKFLHDSWNAWLSMYDTKGNKQHLCVRDNLFNCRQPHHHIHLKEKEQVLQCTNSKILFVKRNFYFWKLKDKIIKLFWAPINCCVIVLWKFFPLVISPLSEGILIVLQHFLAKPQRLVRSIFEMKSRVWHL